MLDFHIELWRLSQCRKDKINVYLAYVHIRTNTWDYSVYYFHFSSLSCMALLCCKEEIFNLFVLFYLFPHFNCHSSFSWAIGTALFFLLSVCVFLSFFRKYLNNGNSIPWWSSTNRKKNKIWTMKNSENRAKMVFVIKTQSKYRWDAGPLIIAIVILDNIQKRQMKNARRANPNPFTYIRIIKVFFIIRWFCIQRAICER